MKVIESAQHVRERPILFSGPMVRAILEGRKTQTRRIAKEEIRLDWFESTDGREVPAFVDKRGCCPIQDNLHLGPYGIPGDRLWVKETFCPSPDGIIYRATEEEAGMHQPDDECVWKPSIFMRREYSRLTLEITKVRVERLQDISEYDAEAEGVIETEEDRATAQAEQLADRSKNYTPSVVAYRTLWNSINGTGSWEKNPWVWVLEFKRLEIANA